MKAKKAKDQTRREKAREWRAWMGKLTDELLSRGSVIDDALDVWVKEKRTLPRPISSFVRAVFDEKALRGLARKGKPEGGTGEAKESSDRGRVPEAKAPRADVRAKRNARGPVSGGGKKRPTRPDPRKRGLRGVPARSGGSGGKKGAGGARNAGARGKKGRGGAGGHRKGSGVRPASP